MPLHLMQSPARLASLLSLTSMFWLGLPAPVHAQSFTCSASASPSTLNAGNIAPWTNANYSVTGSISVSCTNSSFFSGYVSACLSIGTGSAGNSFNSRQISLSGNNTAPALAIAFTSNSAYFGSYYNGASSINFGPVWVSGRTTTTIGSVPVTMTVTGTTGTNTAGTYTSSYSAGHTALAIASGSSGSCVNTLPNSGTFPFTVSATVPNLCEISKAPTDMAFPTTTGIKDVSQSAQSSVTLRCTSATPYNITLLPSNNSPSGNGQMKAVGAPSNTDTVPYSLYQDTSNTVWGNIIGGNAKSGTGSGNAQVITIYGVVPADLNVTPGNYKDTVVLTVTY